MSRYINVNSPDLLLYLPLNSTSGTVAQDNGSAGNNGAITDCTWLDFEGERCLDLSAQTSIITLNSEIALSTEWTIEARFVAPLPVAAGGWNTLTWSAGGGHAVLVQSGVWLGGYLYRATPQIWYSSGFDMRTLSEGWHHLAAVASGSTVAFYIDGALVGSVAANPQQWIKYVGNLRGGNTQPFGKISHFAVWNRALSVAELQPVVYQYGAALALAGSGAFVFNDWLLDPRNQRYRATLIEIHADSGLYRLATQPYFQPDGAWDDLLLDEVIVESALDASVSVGDFTFSDDYRTHWGVEDFYGRPCRVWLGDTRWARSAFVQIADLVIDHIQRQDDGVFRVTFTDAMPLLEEKVVGTKVNGQPMPVVYGSPRNVTPIMTDYLTRTYRFSESALTAISAVRDRGKTPATITKLLPTGSVKIGVNVAGTITGDVTAAQTFLRDVVAALLTRAGIATTAASIVMRRFPAAYPNGYPLDIYIDDQPTYRDLLQTICESCGASLAREANGAYSLTYITFDGTPSLTLTSGDILEISEESREPVYKQITVNYNKNYTVQTASELAGGVSMADVKKYGSDYYGTLTATTNYSGSLHDGTLTHDILSGQAEAQAEAERLAERYAVPRRKWRIEATQTAINVQVGDLITIADIALSGVVLVVAVSKNNTDLTADLECIA